MNNYINLLRAPDIYQVLVSLGGSLNSILLFIAALAYFFSIVMIISVVHRLAQHGNQTNPEKGVSGIVAGFFIAVLVFYLPSTLDTISYTVFQGEGSAFAYTAPSFATLKVTTALTVIYRFIGICGVCAVITGLMHWNKVSQGVDRHYAKGSWHIIGGWMAIHLDDVMHVLKTTVGV